MNSIIVRRNGNNSLADSDKCQNDILSVTRELQQEWIIYEKSPKKDLNYQRTLLGKTKNVQLKLIYTNVDELTLNSIE